MSLIKKYIFSVVALFLVLSAVFTPAIVSAHEVYVLHANEIESAITTPSPNPFSVIPEQEQRFIWWGVLSIIIVLIVLTVSISPLFERVFDPVLMRLKKYAPFICRITLGFSLLASGYYSALFGPELPLFELFPAPMDSFIATLLMIAGVCLVFGFLTRLWAVLGIALYIYSISQFQIYMLMYINYFGEFFLSLVLGGGMWSLDHGMKSMRRLEIMFQKFKRALEPYSFLILRLSFGIAVFSASFYAKFLHSNLALDVVNDYHLTNYFHFTPLFLVLGAFIIEAIAGICLFFGFELRFIALFLTFFLTLSIYFFGESVWPHIILFGVTIAIFCHGYDKYTIEKALFQRGRKGEPVL